MLVTAQTVMSLVALEFHSVVVAVVGDTVPAPATAATAKPAW
jgi:hypothetical protein